jgi:hypothetical protein
VVVKIALKLPREPVSGLLGITPARSNKKLYQGNKAAFYY